MKKRRLSNKRVLVAGGAGFVFCDQGDLALSGGYFSGIGVFVHTNGPFIDSFGNVTGWTATANGDPINIVNLAVVCADITP